MTTRLGEIGALMDQGQPETALAQADALLAEDPRDPELVAWRVYQHFDADEAEEALSLIGRLLAHAPHAAGGIAVLQAAALHRAGHTDRGIDLLQHHADAETRDLGLLEMLANLSIEAKRGEAVPDICSRMGQIDVTYPGGWRPEINLALDEARIEHAEALLAKAEAVSPELLEALAETRARASELSGYYATALEQVARARAALKAGDHAVVAEATNAGATAAAHLGEADIGFLLRMAERHGLTTAASALIDAILTRPTMSLGLAQHFVTLAGAAGKPAPVEAMRAALEGKLRPEEATHLRAEAVLVAQGAPAALSAFREEVPIATSPADIALRLRLLREDARFALAFRVCRAAVARWPQDATLRFYLAQLYTDLGAYEAGLAWLDSWADQAATRPLRARMAAGAGMPEMAVALTRMAAEDGDVGLHPLEHARLLIDTGEMGDYAASLESMARHADLDMRLLHRMPSSMLGSLLADRKIFEAAQAAGETPPVARSFYAARAALWETTETTAGDGAIPRQMLHYTGRKPPGDDTRALLTDWDAMAGIEHVEMDRRAAQKYLREHFNPRVGRAFATAGSFAEQEALLRFAWLHREGGAAVPLDSRRGPGFAALFDAPADLVLERSGDGSVPTDLILATPGHAAIRAALRLQVAGLLRQEDEDDWFQFGPGMMTRAVALAADEDGVPKTVHWLAPAEARRCLTGPVLLARTAATPHWNRDVVAVSEAISVESDTSDGQAA